MMSFDVIRITSPEQYHQMLDVFEEAFEDSENYGRPTRPGQSYIATLLGNGAFIGLLAQTPQGEAMGALAAYVLPKFEQARSEIYLYDLGVRALARRKGVATQLIHTLQGIARELGAWVVFVQADSEEEDLPARTLYRKLGTEESVFHYDIKP